jgi:hypothetical protein
MVLSCLLTGFIANLRLWFARQAKESRKLVLRGCFNSNRGSVPDWEKAAIHWSGAKAAHCLVVIQRWIGGT